MEASKSAAAWDAVPSCSAPLITSRQRSAALRGSAASGVAHVCSIPAWFERSHVRSAFHWARSVVRAVSAAVSLSTP
jgi:hypothetical protein